MYEKEGMNNPPVVVQATIPQGTASNPVPIYGRPASATSNPIYATAPGSANPVYAQPTYPNADSNTNRLGPPTGAWRDGICDCCTNLWPSCGCLLFCHGAWILGQISQKVGYIPFRNIMLPMLIIEIICFFCALFLGGWVYWIPGIIVLFLQMLVRVKVIQYYRITQHNELLECCISFWCSPCSIAQMARHVYGYRLVFDGDADPEVSDYYANAQNQV